MGTRCLIKVEGMKGVAVYKHWDGYPSGTFPWLKKFNKTFTKERGDDSEYKFAQLLRSSAFDCEEFGLGKDRATGWGVIPHKSNEDTAFDIAYIYILKKDGKVEAFEPIQKNGLWVWSKISEQKLKKYLDKNTEM